MTGYRIGYLNPWSQSAENQCYESLRIAAHKIGHDLISVTNSDEILAANLDYVIAIASTQAKTTHIPTFANIHEPRTRWWESEAYFWNLLTYDGYVTISESLETFIRAFCNGFGKDPSIGAYFNTPQRQQIRADIYGLAKRDAVNLCYFGTNWDPRSRPLFRELSKRPYMQIRGPERSWQQIPPSAYFGMVPFDGQSVQTVYAANGAGLVVQSRNHTIDDVVSNRIFEICSVGAVVINPEMPWVHDKFGDSVFYFDPWAPAEKVAARIDDIMNEIRRDPVGAAQRAETARSIFEKTFCAEVLIDNTARYYEGWRERTNKLRAPDVEQPMIDVIVRVGGRPAEMVTRAIKSIDDQSVGRFRIVLVRYKPVDMSPITDAKWKNIEAFETVDCMGGNRAQTMAAGLSALESTYFAALDDDDFWLPDHAASMWRVLQEAPRDSGLAYCGLMNVEEGESDPAAPLERRTIVSLTPARGTIWDIVGKFGTINFMASTKLAKGLALNDWQFTTAEDTLMICHMLPKATVGFTWRATACTSVHPNDRSNYNVQSLRRKEDVLEVFLRLGPKVEAIERMFPATPSTTWTWLGTRVGEVFEAKTKAAFRDEGRLVLEEGMLGASIHDRDDVVATEILLDSSTMSMSGAGYFGPVEGSTAAMIVPPQQAWAYAASIDVRPWLHTADQQWIVMEFDEIDGAFGVGLLKADGSDFYTRTETPRRTTPVELWLYVGNREAISQLVVQNWGTFEGNKATLRKIWAVRRK
jgi:hypothetical protein